MKLILLFLLAVIFYAPAEYFSKVFGKDPSFMSGLYAVLCYTLSTFVWLIIIYIKKDLFTSSLAWFGIGISISFIVGVVMFGETLKAVNVIGAILAIISAILLMI